MEVSKKVSRRGFIKVTSLSGAFLALGLPNLLSAAGKPVAGLENISGSLAKGVEINPFIIIEESGQITIFSHRPDMGQGTWQSMPMIVAEELEVDPKTIQIKPTRGEKKYGGQLSGGSTSVRGSWDLLRKAGASTKEMLVKAASQQWNVPLNECYASEAKVYHKPSGKSLTYGELVAAASKLEVPAEPKLKDPSEFKWVGKSLPRPEIPLKVNGSAIFGMDQKIPGMLYASVERCPTIHGKVKSIDDSEALKVPGVKQVLKVDRNVYYTTQEGVAVVADSYFSALTGRKKLKIEWELEPEKNTDTDVYFEQLRKLADTPGAVHEEVADFNQMLEKAPKKLVSRYETPFEAHAPMEPECALVHVKGDSCEIWASVQGPDTTVDAMSGYLKIPAENITVHTPFLGGAFGRKAYYDYLFEAADLSKKISAPVKIIWTREDDTTQGPFRPAMLSHMEGTLDKGGNLTGLHHKVVSHSIQAQVFNSLEEGKPDMWALGEINKEELPYSTPKYKTSFVLAETQIPICWWRSVYCSTTIYGQESFIDEMAVLAGKDPLQFRMDMMKGKLRFYNVLKELREKSGWDKPLGEGKGKGVAISKSFGSIVAHVVYVGRDPKGKMKIEKVVSMVDCGMTVNPDNIVAQIEGSIIMGITAAIKDPITIKDGKVQQTNFHNYQMLRMNEIPELEVHIVKSLERPGGIGEPGLPPVAPALTNAIYSATKNRIKKLPFKLEEV